MGASLSFRWNFRATGLLLLGLAFLLVGCLKAPERFRIISLEQSCLRTDHIEMRFVCSVRNPNISRLEVRDLTAQLRVEGIVLGQLERVERLRLPGRRTTEFAAQISIPYQSLLKLLPLALTRSQFDVEIEGQCRAGTWYTFRHRVHHTDFLTVDIREVLYKQLLEALKR